MFRSAFIAALIASLIASTADAAPRKKARPVTVEPPSRWAIESDPVFCRLVFQDASAKPPTVSLLPGSSRFPLIFAADKGEFTALWFTQPTDLPDGTRFSDATMIARKDDATSPIIAIGVSHNEFEQLSTKPIQLRTAQGDEMSFPAVDAEGREMLSRCERGRLEQWGGETARLDAIKVWPKFDGNRWYTGGDYPIAVMAKEIGGRARALLHFRADGSVEKCAVVESSGTPELDGATCRVALRRGKATPALDKDGKPVPSLGLISIVWKIGI